MTEELIYKYKIISLDYIKNRNITLAIKTLVEGLEINNRDVETNNSINNNKLYPQRVIHITPPTAYDKKRPPENPTVKKGEFIF